MHLNSHSCRKFIFFWTCCLSSLAFADTLPPPPKSLSEQEFEINLKNPIFVQGVIKTDEGGVITSPNIRIQAEHIAYTNRIENGILVKKIEAEGDLLFQHGNRAFVGRRLEYNFETGRGLLSDGATFTGVWFIGGKEVELRPDGTYAIYDSYITTSASQEASWGIYAHAVKVTKGHLLSARGITFRYIKLPIFWLPSFKMNLKFFTDPPVKYKIRWDKGLGPRATMRYRLFSWEDFNLFFRLDYRLKRGFGSAIESEYYSPDERTIFLTKNYGAHDKEVPDEKGPKRYRLQGLYQWQSLDDRTHIHATYDKLSDEKMAGDFKNDDFEVNTEKRSIFTLDHQREALLSQLVVQPRINRFQSLNQQLPNAFTSLHPLTFGKSGIIADHYATAGYLDYAYIPEVRKVLPHVCAGRLEWNQHIYRPISLNPVTVTPSVGFIGIFYTNNPMHHSTGQAILSYGLEAKTRLLRSFQQRKSIFEPYLNFVGLTRPTSGLNNHFIFSIEDGFARINTLRIGVRNLLFNSRKPSLLPEWTSDLYTYGYMGKTAFHYPVPKAYLSLGWNRPSLSLKGLVGWNIQEHLFDVCNVIGEWTVSRDLAFAVEMRHRSRFDWRKADHENFILDVARPISELLRSPLSDGRNTLLMRLHARLSPKWTAHFESHHGWGRAKEPMYHAFKIDLMSIIATSWQLKISYEHTPEDDRFAPSLSIVK
jgi:hypothetical protein